MRRDYLSLPCAHVGVIVELLRTVRGMSILEVVAALYAQGYIICPAKYGEIEDGWYRPTDAQQFAHACSAALQLRSDELHALVAQWAYDLLCVEFGEALARALLQDAFHGERRVIAG